MDQMLLLVRKWTTWYALFPPVCNIHLSGRRAYGIVIWLYIKEHWLKLRSNLEDYSPNMGVD